MIYREAVEYLNRFVDFERLPEPRLKTEPEDIERFKLLLTELGNPHLSYPTIHIAGTKGKGSTSAMLASILHASGYKVGLYTSPHLISVRERIAVAGRDITKRDFSRAMSLVRKRFGQLNPEASLAFRTVFELITAAGFIEFARQKVDVAIIGAGMGARLDATIVIEPILAVMTPIGLDHTHLLGNTVGLIAADKAHIIKQGVPCVSAPQVAEARYELEGRARKQKTDLIYAPGPNEFDLLSSALHGSHISLKRDWLGDSPLFLSLPGKYQLGNLSVVLTALERLKAAGYQITDESVELGLSRVSWPGRMQVVSKSPRVILDGAHNTLAINALIDSYRELLPGSKPQIVFSAITGKPLEEMLLSLATFDSIIHLAPLRFPKTFQIEQLQTTAEKVGLRYRLHQNVPNAIDAAKVTAGVRGDVLITGSLYLVGEALRHIKGLPQPPSNGAIDDSI